MNRITMRDLEGMVKAINCTAGTPQEPYTKHADGYTANIGCYLLAGAYGGWKLEQIVTDGGGVTSITSGYESKRNLYNQLAAFLRGLESGKEC